MKRRTIRKGGKIGKGYNYVFETGEVTFSNDPNIPVGSNVYRDNLRRDQRKPELKERDKIKINPTDDNANRVRKILEDLIGIKNSDDKMMAILEAVKDTVTPVPIPYKYYTFVYNAETPNILYDQFPLIYCEDISQSKDGYIYFSGLNFHFPMRRVYRIDRVVGQLYEVDVGEISDLIEITYAKFLNT